MSAEAVLLEWIRNYLFERPEDRKMQRLAIRVLSERVQYDSYDSDIDIDDGC